MVDLDNIVLSVFIVRSRLHRTAWLPLPLTRDYNNNIQKKEHNLIYSKRKHRNNYERQDKMRAAIIYIVC